MDYCICPANRCRPVTPVPPAIHCAICAGVISAAKYSAWHATQPEPQDEHDSYGLAMIANAEPLHAIDYARASRLTICGLPLASHTEVISKTLEGICPACKAKIEASEQEMIKGMASDLRAALPLLSESESLDLAANVADKW